MKTHSKGLTDENLQVLDLKTRLLRVVQEGA